MPDMRASLPLPAVIAQRAASLIGFTKNGSANNALFAALSGVKAGTRRGKIVWKGDSTTVGQGGGTNADSFGLTGARANRPPAIVAAQLSSAGIAALDACMVGDAGMSVANGFSFAAYEPRATLNGWVVKPVIGFAGGSFLATDTSLLSFAPGGTTDAFEVVYYNSASTNYTATIDGNVPVSGGSFGSFTGTGFVRATVAATAAGTHSVALAANNVNGALRSIRGYNSGIRAMDMIVHASLGAKAADQASSSAGSSEWNNLEALKFDAPDLTIINLGLNDMNANVTTGAFTSSLQSIITAAKVSGDVLLLFPQPAAGSYNNNVAAYNAATKQLAADNGVAFFSLYEYFGSAFTTALGNRMFDGSVHPKAELYAEIGARITDAIKLMVAGRGVF